MPRGIVRCGFFTSSPAVATASAPMNEKKIIPAAAPTPAAPRTESGDVFGVDAVRQFVEETTPSDGHRRSRLGVLRQHAGGDHHGHQFAEGGLRVGMVEPETGMADGISAEHNADGPAAMPARMKETVIAGPASGTRPGGTKKMPVPTVAPMPNMVSWKVPTVRFSSRSCVPAGRHAADRLPAQQFAPRNSVIPIPS